ncbi:TlpA family protein disulfide reductase [Defluviicoccus vanus]|uniref:TlpA family protein disulfide reductase n=1 Tax=Defluviicoccus vanus TaxID=111831 RepID=A0A7H1MYF0_9PROT|nr:TlpA family protein disulfide reductase [Defluviicoccus vanus]
MARKRHDGRLQSAAVITRQFFRCGEAASSSGSAVYRRDGQGAIARSVSGAALVVNFWATWCGPCIKEMPALDALAKKVEKRGIVVLALSSDREGAPVVRQYFDKNGLTGLPVSIDALSKVARTLDIVGLPTTVFFDAQGRQVGRVVGAAEWDAPATIEFLTACLAPAA